MTCKAEQNVARDMNLKTYGLIMAAVPHTAKNNTPSAHNTQDFVSIEGNVEP
jgi:hypothetical protein